MMMQKNLRTFLAWLYLTILFTMGCDVNILPPPIEDPPENNFTVMTYNVLYGAGATEDCALKRENKYSNIKPAALDDIINVIESVNPEILGIQEAIQWEENDEAVAKDVSQRLGMNYALGPGWSDGWNVALYTRYEILETQTYTEEFRVGGLRARLLTPWGEELNVFVVHLTANPLSVRTAELEFLVTEMEKFHDLYTLVIGDFNFTVSDLSGFKDEGWNHLQGDGIDHIWGSPSIGISPDGSLYIETVPINFDQNYLLTLSDHLPVMVKTGIY